MPRPTLTASLINDLRQRVIAHNEAARLSGVDCTSLGDLKKVYIGAYRGQDPAARAMAAVDRRLNVLSKAEQFDETKHPRDKGKFASKGAGKIAEIVPAKEKEHQDLQTSSAGYRALTSDVLPEYRYQVAGAALRDGLAAGIGAATIASLSRRGGWVRALAGKTGAGVGRLAGVGTTNAAFIAAHAASAISSKAKKKLTDEYLTHQTDKASDWLAHVGSKAAQIPVNVASRGVREAMHIAGRPGTKWARRGRKAATFAALSAIPAVAANSAMQSTIDPERFGAGIDATSYRVVQKIADSDELRAASEAMRASIQGLEEPLEKNAMYSNLGRAIFGSLAAAGGAALGSVAARQAVLRGLAVAGTAAAGAAVGAKAENAIEHSGRRGNPYHDERGRFTSHDAAAVVGGVAGAALAGLGAIAAIRAHNIRAWKGIVHGLMANKRSAIEEASEGFVGSGPHVKMNAERATLAQDALEKDPVFAAQKEALDKHENSSVVHYIGKINDEVNRKIADVLAAHGAVKLPTKEGAKRGAAVWRTVDEITQDARPGTKGAAQHQAILDFAERATPEDFDKAIEGLDPRVQDTARRLLHTRMKATADVSDELDSHLKEIDAQDAVLQSANEATRQAVAHEATMQSVHAGADEANKEAAKVALDRAVAATKAARKTQGEAMSALVKLKKAGAPIKSPITGKVIAPATDEQVSLRRKALTKAATDRAETKVDRDIESARNEHIGKLSEEHNRTIAAASVLGLKHGGVPAEVRPAAEAYRAADEEVARQELHLAKAKEDAVNAGIKLRALKAKKKGQSAAFDPANPDHAQIQAKTEETAAALKAAKAELKVRESKRDTAAGAFHDAMVAHDEATAPPPGRMPGWIAESLRNDLNLATEGVSAAWARFLQAPGAQTFADFVANRYADAKSGAVHAYDVAEKAFTDSYHELFMHQNEDKSWSVSPWKVIRNVPVVAGAIGGGFEAASFAKQKLFGNEEDASRAKLPDRFKIDRNFDPVTGEGHVAIGVADPENKGDHILLWGKRFERNGNDRPIPLHAGGRMSLLRQRLAEVQRGQNGQNGQKGSGTPLKDASLPGDLKKEIDTAISKMENAKPRSQLESAPAGDGRRVEYRADSAAEHQGVAGKFMGQIRGLLRSGNGGDAQKALRMLFSSQGRILGQRQIYEAVTGFRTDGKPGDAGRGVLLKNDGFASNDPGLVTDALTEEVPKALKAHPDDQEWKDALHRAVGIVSRVKNVSREAQNAVHALIAPASGQAAQPHDVPALPRPAVIPQPTMRADIHDARTELRLPSHWVHETLNDDADRAADDISQYNDGPMSTGDLNRVRSSIERLAISAHHRNADLMISEHEGVAAAHSLVRSLLDGGDEADTQRVLESLKHGKIHTLTPMIDDYLEPIVEEREYYQKSAEPTEMQKLAAEFVLAKSGESLPKALLEGGVEGGTQLASREAMRSNDAPTQSFFSPGRVAHELGAGVAADTAWQLAMHYAGKFIPGYQAFKAGSEALGDGASMFQRAQHAVAAPNIAAHGVALAASAGAGAAGGYAADRLTGSQYNPEEDSAAGTLGRLGGTVAGDFAGQKVGGIVGRAAAPAFGRIAGGLVTRAASALTGRAIGAGIGEGLGALAGPVGIIAGGAIGSWAAGEAGSRLANYFSGHDAGQVQRATRRYLAPRATAAGVKPPRVPGASIGTGGRGGDPYHDMRGRFSAAAGEA